MKFYLIFAAVVAAIYQWYAFSPGYFIFLAVYCLLVPAYCAWKITRHCNRKQLYDLAVAYSWGQWDEVFKLADELHGDEAVALELIMRKAGALGALGRVDEGNELLEGYTMSPELPDWLGFACTAEMYTMAWREEDALRCLEQAYAAASENPSVESDYAMALLRLQRDSELAAELIASVEKKPLKTGQHVCYP